MPELSRDIREIGTRQEYMAGPAVPQVARSSPSHRREVLHFVQHPPQEVGAVDRSPVLRRQDLRLRVEGLPGGHGLSLPFGPQPFQQGGLTRGKSGKGQRHGIRVYGGFQRICSESAN